MQEEIEVKILNIDKPAVISRLEQLGAQKTLEARLRIWEYDFPDHRLKKVHETCRIRTEGDKIVLCYKRRAHKGDDLYGYKVRLEAEKVVEDLADAQCSLLNKGMIGVAYKEKDRVSYKLENIHFDIDQWPRIPPYLEVEAPSTELVDKGVSLLGFSKCQMNSLTQTDVFRLYCIDVDKNFFELKF